MGIKKMLNNNGVYISFFALLLFNIFKTPNFNDIATYGNMAVYSLNILLVSMGMSLVIAMKGIDISIGSIMAVSSIVMAVAIEKVGIPAAIILGILSSIILGALNGYLIVRFKIAAIIVTLSSMMALRGLAQIFSSGKIITLKNSQLTEFLYYRIGGKIPVQAVFFVIVTLIFWILIKKTIFGRYVEAIGDNQEAAMISGINVGLYIIIVHGLIGSMAGLAGVIETARLSVSNPNSVGLMLELDAIAAVAVGSGVSGNSKPKIIATMVGVLLMQLITMTINMNNISYSYSLLIKTIIIILSVYLQKESKQGGNKNGKSFKIFKTRRPASKLVDNISNS